MLSPAAVEKINGSLLEELVITNSIEVKDKVEECSKIKTLSIAFLLAEAMKRIHEEKSISVLFD